MRRADNWVLAISLLLGLWGSSQLPGPSEGSWTRALGAPPRVRILQFRSSACALTKGQKAQLCYGVENARSVRIAPMPALVAPSLNRCIDITPRRTTRYTLMAIGWDDSVAKQSLTLAVEAAPEKIPELLELAGD